MFQVAEGPFRLEEIKDALVLRALDHNLFQPLKSFFGRMHLTWGEAQTAYARLIGSEQWIVLGTKFFGQHVQSVSEAVDILLHEILHHVFCHLLHNRAFLAQGYNSAIQGLAEDAINNAHLAQIKSAGFMARFYRDYDCEAFLRPGSYQFLMPVANEPRLTRPAEQINADLYKQFRAFYERLQGLDMTLEAALAFFKQHFPDVEDTGTLLLGGHGGERQSGSTEPGSPNTKGLIFSSEEASAILGALNHKGIVKRRNNFAQAIKQITTTVRRPGVERTGMRQSRRLPAKLRNQDMLRLELGDPLFRTADYRQKLCWIMLDVSGSFEPYLPFVCGLIRGLRTNEIAVKAVCWADQARIVDLQDLRQGKIPSDVGLGTTGENLAQFIAKHKVPQCVIVTDNEAGNIETPIIGKVVVALCQGGKKEGSFLDRSKVPHCSLYELVLG